MLASSVSWPWLQLLGSELPICEPWSPSGTLLWFHIAAPAFHLQCAMNQYVGNSTRLFACRTSLANWASAAAAHRAPTAASVVQPRKVYTAAAKPEPAAPQKDANAMNSPLRRPRSSG